MRKTRRHFNLEQGHKVKMHASLVLKFCPYWGGWIMDQRSKMLGNKGTAKK